MILRKVSAALLLRDGFTGETLENGSATRCFLDGRPLSGPVWKRDGYLVLTDLPVGRHELRISRRGYLDETVTLCAQEEKPIEDTVSLKPGRGYRFPPDTVRVTVALRQGPDPLGDRRLWLGLRPRKRLKLSREKAGGEDGSLRLFCEGSTALLPVPGYYLLADDAAPELIFLRSLRGEEGEAAQAPAFSHSRGTELVPVQAYRTDGAGTVQVLLREPGMLTGFFGGRVFEARLQAGEQDIIWKTEE